MSTTAASAGVYFTIAGAVGVSSIVLDAIGEHLKKTLNARQRRAWQTANAYHLVHSAGLVAVAWMLALARNATSKSYLVNGFYLMLAGALGFGSSIYALCLGAPRWVGPVTPTSGLILVLGWLNVGLAGLTW